MKTNFICFKFSKTFFLIICITAIAIVFFVKQIVNSEEENIQMPLINNMVDPSTNYSLENQVEIQIVKKSRVLPEKLKGFEIVGKIEIPKLNLEKYILGESSSKALQASVTKLCGPQINKIGNFCIAGHNYNRVFGKIKYLEKDDKIILTDVYGKSVTYQIYDVYKTSPKDVSCLNQDTESERELTLITCTMGALKRVIVKAIEVYD